MEYHIYKPKVELVWCTPEGDAMIARMARVSANEHKDKPVKRLLQYLAEHKHHSPFEMANMCVEVYAPRDITRQMIRHRSFSFQEFSGRYAEYSDSAFVLREPRLQHPSNRQMSVDVDHTLHDQQNAYEDFMLAQQVHIDVARISYHSALAKGIAKEQARCMLPEGNLLSRLYMNGTVRSWIHYLQIRCDKSSAQREHAQVADAIMEIFEREFPITHSAFFE